MNENSNMCHYLLIFCRYDPQATQFISFDQLSEFLANLDPPLGIPKPNIVAIVAFNLPIARGNKIHCLDIIHALVKHVLGHIDDTEEFRKVRNICNFDSELFYIVILGSSFFLNCSINGSCKRRWSTNLGSSSLRGSYLT